MFDHGAIQPICYCASSGFTARDNLNLWNFVTNKYRVVGYAMTFPGTATVLLTNQNPSMTPQAMTDTKTGVTYPPPDPSARVMMADAVISKPHNADEVNRWLNSYIGIKGGNLAMMDGHTEWRKFYLMHVRTDSTSPNPVFWWC